MGQLIILDADGKRRAIEMNGIGSDNDPFIFNAVLGGGEVQVIDIGTISAGENHIGEVANGAVTISPTVTVSTSPAYTSGDAIGSKLTLANATRISGGITMLQTISLIDRSNQKPTGFIYFYNADPSAATLTDNTAIANSTDDAKIIGQVPILGSDYTVIDGKK